MYWLVTIVCAAAMSGALALVTGGAGALRAGQQPATRLAGLGRRSAFSSGSFGADDIDLEWQSFAHDSCQQ
jgi:hypothetical protein